VSATQTSWRAGEIGDVRFAYISHANPKSNLTWGFRCQAVFSTETAFLGLGFVFGSLV
jgi:hypothetical protein